MTCQMENPDFSARTNRTVVTVAPQPTAIEAGNLKDSCWWPADNLIMNEIKHGGRT